MTKIDLGRSGSKWETIHNLELIKAIRSLYCGHLPYSFECIDVVEYFFKNYETTRSRSSVYEQMHKLLNKVGGVFNSFEQYNYNGQQYYVAREFSDITTFIKENATPLYSITEHGRTKSYISLSKIKNDALFFTFPIIVDADYGRIFFDIYSIDYTNNLKVKTDLDNLLSIELDDSYYTIPQSWQEYGILPLCIHYLLDLLFAKLYGEISKLQDESCSKDIQKKRYETKKEIRQLLSFFRRSGYIFSLENKLRDAIEREKLPLEKLDYSILSNIMEKSDESHIMIPAYKIWMSGVFELYVYSHLKKENKETVLYKPAYEKKEPDIVVPDYGIVLDAKYKFQYDLDNRYCEIADVQRMINYLFYMYDHDASHPIGIFVYPDIRRDMSIKKEVENDQKQNHIGKIDIGLPVNSIRQQTMIDVYFSN